MNKSMGYRAGNIWKAGLVLVALAMTSTVTAEKFRAHEIPNTGAGYHMTASSFTYLRLHEAIQTADIDNDGNQDIVVLADGNLPNEDDYKTAGGSITDGDYLYSASAPEGRESPNVRLGKACCRDLGSGVDRIGSDLAWYKNDGNGYFYPVFVTPWEAGVSTHAFIYSGKTLAVGDIDNDGDQDMVVWASLGAGPDDRPLGAQRVTWFENRWFETAGIVGDRYSLGSDIYPRFKQHDVITGLSTGLFYYVAPTSYSVTNPRSGTLADMDGDGLKDIVVMDYAGAGAGYSGFYWIRNRGGAVPRVDLTPGNIFPVKISPSGTYYRRPFGITVVAADLDSDGNMDLVLGENGLAGPTTRQVIFLRNMGSGDSTFDQSSVKNDFYVTRSLAVADVIPGGCMEIITGGKEVPGVGSIYNSALSVFSNDHSNCSGGWTRHKLNGAATLPEIWDIRVTDLNGDDARPDVCALSVGNTLLGGSNSLTTCWINDSNNPSDWTPFPLVEAKAPPTMTTLGGGLAMGDFDLDGDTDTVRAHFETNLTFFENTWNTERQVQVTTTAKKNGVKQKVTSLFGTNPDKSMGKMSAQKVQNQ